MEIREYIKKRAWFWVWGLKFDSGRGSIRRLVEYESRQRAIREAEIARNTEK